MLNPRAAGIRSCRVVRICCTKNSLLFLAAAVLRNGFFSRVTAHVRCQRASSNLPAMWYHGRVSTPGGRQWSKLLFIARLLYKRGKNSSSLVVERVGIAGISEWEQIYVLFRMESIQLTSLPSREVADPLALTAQVWHTEHCSSFGRTTSPNRNTRFCLPHFAAPRSY